MVHVGLRDGRMERLDYSLALYKEMKLELEV